MDRSRRPIFLGIILIALGIAMNSSLVKDGQIGTVFIAVGGLFFIIGMARRKKDGTKN